MLWVLLNIAAYMGIMGFVYFQHHMLSIPPTKQKRRRRGADLDDYDRDHHHGTGGGGGTRHDKPQQEQSRNYIQQAMINGPYHARRDYLGTNS